MSQPKDSEVEITVIGTGGGYGECILLKVGINSWIIVDSCINPNTDKPLAIEYLESIGIDYKSAVVQIICTHWHDDHIKGLAYLLDVCKNAEFCMTRVNDIKKFLKFVKIDKDVNTKGGIRSTKEFEKCLQILNAKSAKAIRISSDQVVYNKTENGVNFTLYALSPSNAVVSDFDKEISVLIDAVQYSQNSIVNKSPNDKSVALLLKFGEQRVLLGADLEVGTQADCGWLDILNNSKVTDSIKAKLFKLSHHGSENGYDIRIFQQMVEDNSVLKMTPWNHGAKLPTANMILTYKSHSDDLYITSPIISANQKAKPKQRPKEISRIIDDFNKTLSEVKFQKGVIRSRCSYTENAEWRTDALYNAFRIS